MSVLKLGRILGVCIASLVATTVQGSHSEVLRFDFSDPEGYVSFFVPFQVGVQEGFVPLYSSSMWAYTKEDDQRSMELARQSTLRILQDSEPSVKENVIFDWEKQWEAVYEGDVDLPAKLDPKPKEKTCSPGSFIQKPIETSEKGPFDEKKAKTRLSRGAHTKGMLTFPRSHLTSFSSKGPFSEVPIEKKKRIEWKKKHKKVEESSAL